MSSIRTFGGLDHCLKASRAYLERMIPRVRQVMHQARERVFKGNTHVPGKIVSLFEPHTEVIRKGKASKPTEFGKMVKIQEAEAQIVTNYKVLQRAAQRLRPAATGHRRPQKVAASQPLSGHG
jgi:hypothetical protein